MSAKIESSEQQKIDLSKLGQFYSPIDFFEYGQSQTVSALETNEISPIEPKKSNNISSNSPNINIISNKKKLKVKFKKIATKTNDSFAKKSNNSYNISRNDNNINEITTTISTIDDKTNITSINTANTIEEKSKLNKLKELMICCICQEKVVVPKICPLCFKIACDECIKKWFVTKGNKTCFHCKKNISLEKMISIPVINNISNILNKKTIDIKNDSSLVLKQLSSRNNRPTNANLNSYTNNITSIDSSRSNVGNCINKFVNNSLDLRKCLKKIKHRKFPNSISETRKSNIDKHNMTNINNSNTDNSINTDNINISNEHCEMHKDQLLFYYCVNCEKSYCRTCFVFFGEEKNKHIGHKIIDYEKLKDKNNFELFKEIKNLKEKSIKINNFINKCESIKNCYNLEKNIVNSFIKSFINNYNEKIAANIKIIDEIINNYKNYLEQITKERNNIKKFFLLKYNNNYIVNNLLINIKKLNDNIKDIKENDIDIDIYANLLKK